MADSISWRTRDHLK